MEPDELEAWIADADQRSGRSKAHTGKVTRAFDEWRLAERELLAFLRLGLKLSKEGFDRLWDEIGRMPASEDGPERIDLFDVATDGLSPLQFDWLLMNLVVRDAVTLYEVYLEKALHEVAEYRVGATVVGERSPDWNNLRPIYRGIFKKDPEPVDVHAVIRLRNLLTHRRGELRTDSLRAEYDTKEYGFPDIWIRLEPETVVRHLDTLAASVARIDDTMHGLAWGRGPFGPELQEQLVAAAPWLFVYE
jgi:hypothetical protein